MFPSCRISTRRDRAIFQTNQNSRSVSHFADLVSMERPPWGVSSRYSDGPRRRSVSNPVALAVAIRRSFVGGGGFATHPLGPVRNRLGGRSSNHLDGRSSKFAHSTEERRAEGNTGIL